MIKNALQYIVGLRKPEIIEVGGETYCDKPLEHVSFNPKAKAIEMTTLTSLVDYISSQVDELSDKMIVHVVSPTKVELYSCLDNERQREKIVVVNANVPEFPFDHFVDSERFNIALQSKFMPSDDRELLLKFAGTVDTGTICNYGDDGVTQKATIKTGPVSKSDAKVPSPATLIPFRTFTEVEQPESEFIFRMQDGRSGVECALFEADGGSWKNEAMKNIKEYFEDHLAEYSNFTIIA